MKTGCFDYYSYGSVKILEIPRNTPHQLKF